MVININTEAACGESVFHLKCDGEVFSVLLDKTYTYGAETEFFDTVMGYAF